MVVKGAVVGAVVVGVQDGEWQEELLKQRG